MNQADGKLGLTDLAECKIETLPNSKGSSKKSLIEESLEGAWASSALLVKKSSGGFQLVTDYRHLNAATIFHKIVKKLHKL